MNVGGKVKVLVSQRIRSLFCILFSPSLVVLCPLSLSLTLSILIFFANLSSAVAATTAAAAV